MEQGRNEHKKYDDAKWSLLGALIAAFIYVIYLVIINA
jgi:hypothetical protein